MRTARYVFVSLLCILFLSTAVLADSGKKQKITNYSAPGNLESRYNIGCIGSNKVKNIYTPPDLYKGVSNCIEKGDYDSAIFLFMIAGAYGRFDSYRVSDKTAHQAPQAAIMQAFNNLSGEKRKAFGEKLKVNMEDGEGMEAICRKIIKIGPPNYYPRYMIQHGMNSFSKDKLGNELVPDFNSKMAWKKSLDTYLHCPNL